MPVELTLEAVQDAVRTAAQAGAEAAVRAMNQVDPNARPGAGGQPGPAGVHPAYRADAPAFIRQRYAPPSIGKAMLGGAAGNFPTALRFEADMVQAAAELWGYRKAENADAGEPGFGPMKIADLQGRESGDASGVRWRGDTIVLPRSRDEMVEVLLAMGERAKAQEIAARTDSAIRAMSEGTGSAGGYLVPTQYAQDKFAYALVSTTAVRQVPGIDVMPVVSNVVALPRESAVAGASQAAEAGALTAADATLGQQTITVKKQYGYRLYSNELLNDATPAWMEFLGRTLVRDVALQQDAQFLFGTGSGAQIQGLIGYSGITSGPSLGTNGRTPSFDDFYDAVYNLRAVNAEPDFVIAHPRVLNSLQKIKDADGNYLASNIGGAGAPALFGTGLQGAPAKYTLLGSIPGFFSSQISIAQTVGSSSDCTTVILGASNQVLILERQGIEVAYSEHVGFANDQSAARAIGRAAIAILQPTAVETITGVRP